MNTLTLFAFLVLLLTAEVPGAAAFSSPNKHLDHRSRQAARNPEPTPGAKHSTERLEEPGRKRNYGTEYTKEKRPAGGEDSLIHRDPKGRAWTFGKVPRW